MLVADRCIHAKPFYNKLYNSKRFRVQILKIQTRLIIIVNDNHNNNNINEQISYYSLDMHDDIAYLLNKNLEYPIEGHNFYQKYTEELLILLSGCDLLTF